MVPGCPPGTYSVEGSFCWGTGQGMAAGSGPADSWGPEVPVVSVSALGPLASCPGCRDVPSVAWRFLGCGEGCPPAPCAGVGSPLVACPWRVVPPTVGWPLNLGGRWRMSWMLRLPPGGGPLEALLAARARLA